MSSGRDTARLRSAADPADAGALLRTIWPLRSRADIARCSKLVRRLVVLGMPVAQASAVAVQVRNLLAFLTARAGRHRQSKTWRITAPDGRSILLPVGDPASRAFKDLVDGYDGFYERALVEFIVQRLGPDDVMVDVGAHVGYVSCFAATTGAAVFAFEIQRELFPLIEEAATINGLDLLRVLHAGAAQAAGLSAIPRSGSTLGGQLTDVKLDGGGFDPGTILQDYVVTVSLDEAFADKPTAPRIVKIDAEGHEIGILRGARRIIERGETTFVVEYHAHMIGSFGHSPEDLFALFDAARWEAFQLDDDGLSPVAGIGDVVPDPHDPNPKLVFQPRRAAGG